MADLFGLSPEEINRIAGQQIDTSKLALDALNTAGYFNRQQAEANKLMNPDLADLDFNGTKFTVRLEDVPQAIAAGARWLEATEKVPVEIGGKTYMVRGGDLKEAIDAGATMAKLPGQLAAEQALTAQRYASAGASGASAGLSSAKTQNELLRQQAIQGLLQGGVTPENIGDVKNFGNILAAHPATASSVLTQKLKPKTATKDPMAMTAALMQKLQKDNAELNAEYVKDKSPHIAVIKDGTNVKVTLPKTAKGQLTAKEVAAEAAARGITPTQWYEEFQRQVKGN